MRLLCWNVQSCRGIDGKVDPARTAAEARRLADPDIVCCQEIDSDALIHALPEYQSAWASGVDVPAVGYDPDSDSGFIVLDIRYDTETLRAMQHVYFSDHAINRIRTYASGAFFAGSHPLVELDRFGNAIWLETGYHLHDSTVAACEFLDSARGKEFAAHEPTAAPIARIRRNLDALLTRI